MELEAALSVNPGAFERDGVAVQTLLESLLRAQINKCVQEMAIEQSAGLMRNLGLARSSAGQVQQGCQMPLDLSQVPCILKWLYDEDLRSNGARTL